jgi:pyruvate,water dikinase
MTTAAADVQPTSFVHSLDTFESRDPAVVGTKAATLARLRAAGFPVPDGFVLSGISVADLGRPAIRQAIGRALATVGTDPVAVRSSASAEDLAGASFAGQYETVLGVAGLAAVLEAAAIVLKSGTTDRVNRYGQHRGEAGAGTAINVLVQRMVPAEVAGVAFTADPMTGDRGRVVVSAVRGLGDRLVSGETQPDEWIVDGDVAAPSGADEGVLDAELARTVAGLARRVEGHEGPPQDIEWAMSGGDLFLLQARPMTGLPGVMSWDPPLPGIWTREIRLGEWLGAPVTPLFESWLLTAIEEGAHQDYARLIGIPIARPIHIVVNGWYFYGFNFLPTRPSAMLTMFVGHVLPRLLIHPRRVAMAFPPLAHFGIEAAERDWRDNIRPAYRQKVEDGWKQVDLADPNRLIALVDALGDAAGHYFTSLTMVAGYASKAEIPLATFYRAHIGPRIGGSHLDLLVGLGEEPPGPQDHAVTTLDWAEPTLGETVLVADPGAIALRHQEARARRLAAEAAAMAALRSEPKILRRFQRLTEEAQHAAVVREDQVAEFTLPWPLLRRAVLRLAEELVQRGVLERPEDVFLLQRTELEGALDGDGTERRALIEGRRQARARQARLVPPLRIGEVPPMFERIVRSAEEAIRGPAPTEAGALVGIPASAGRAHGPARVVHSSDEFDRIQPGDILVCPMTAPAWTAVFDRIVGIVTDTGGVAAHASIIAREYGLPAVVGTGDATVHFQDGELIEVDGSAGVVRSLAARES